MSVIIPVRNAAGHIAMCLRALEQSSVLPAEILVVDDGSCDGSAGVAARFGAHVLCLPESRGPAAARNAGAREARQPVLMFLDADVMVHSDAIELVDAVLSSDSAAGALFGAYDDAPLAPGLVSQYRNLLHHFTHCTADQNAWTFWAGCGAIRRDLFFETGGFDEQYVAPSVEDIELGSRLSRAGAQIRLIPEIQVCHIKEWTLSSMIRTDVLQRAWPWSRLLLRSHSLPSDLNLGWHQRAGAMFAWLSVGLLSVGLLSVALLSVGLLSVGLGAAPFIRGTALLGALAAAGGVALCNRLFFGFLIRARGFVFTVQAFPLHTLFLLYSSATFAVAAVVHFLKAVCGPEKFVANTSGPEARI
jgi:GT2 family glycosyltransferase